jgi:hypothetical protein
MGPPMAAPIAALPAAEQRPPRRAAGAAHQCALLARREARAPREDQHRDEKQHTYA